MRKSIWEKTSRRVSGALAGLRRVGRDVTLVTNRETKALISEIERYLAAASAFREGWVRTQWRDELLRTYASAKEGRKGRPCALCSLF